MGTFVSDIGFTPSGCAIVSFGVSHISFEVCNAAAVHENIFSFYEHIVITAFACSFILTTLLARTSISNI
jgi:hypothetical protein